MTPIVSNVSAFTYLVGKSAKNRLMARIRRVKNPRYALATIIGAVYLWGVYIRPNSSSHGSPINTTGPVALIVLTVLILVITLIAWFVETPRSSLALDDAEAMFVLAGPVSLRGLVGYKLLRSQMGVMFTVLFWSVFIRRGSTLDWPLRAVAVWMFFTTTTLHRTGAELVRASWTLRGDGAWRRRWFTRGIVAAVLVCIAISALLGRVAITAAFKQGVSAGFMAIAHVLQTGPAGVVLWPLQAILRPMTASGSFQWLIALPGALAVLTAHMLWIATTDERSIDVAIEGATLRFGKFRRKVATRRTGGLAVERPKKKGGVLKTMALKSTGWPGGAIIWKNILCMRRKMRPTMLILIAVLPVPMVLPIMISDGGKNIPEMIALLCAAIAGILLLLGPSLLKTDLRADMANIVAIKLMPLRGWTIYSAEVLSVVVPLTVVECALLLVAAITSLFVKHPPLSAVDLAIVIVGVLPAIAAFCTGYVSILNAAPTLFPGWARVDAQKGGGGMEVIGQVAIATIIVVGLLAIMLFLPAAFGGGVIYFGRSHIAVATALGLLLGSAVMAFETGLLIAMLGRVLERTEPTDVAMA